MRFTATEIAGVFAIDLEPRRDDRGFFARAFCPQEFAAAGIAFIPAQINLSRNDAVGTLRGMHWQDAPHDEDKVVRVTAGAIHDVVIDLRPHSDTYGKMVARQLDARTANALFVPRGCAHGFLTLEAATDVLYFMGQAYTPGHARGFRYDDPGVAIEWPATPKVIAPADLAWPPLPRF